MATTAREYLRVSHDRSGREKSNSEQQADNRARWPEFEFVDPPYSDSVSASRYSDKVRGDWKQLGADLEAGRFGAEVLVLWEGSRGSRRTGEWVDLIDLCEKQAVRIAITEDERVYNPANPRDRKSLIDSASDAEYESAKISGRALRTAASQAAAGQPHGRRLYGYRRVYDPDTRKLLGQEPHPQEAPVVRAIFEAHKAGHSIKKIITALTVMAAVFGGMGYGGATTSTGSRWRDSQIRRLLRNPAYVGRRTHRGRDVAGAVWDGIVDRDTFDVVQARLDASGALTPHQPSTAHLLTGVGRCGVCGGKLGVGNSRRKSDGVFRKVYQCKVRFCVVRDLELLEAFVTARLLGWLQRPDLDQALAGAPDPAAESTRQEIAELRGELDEARRIYRGEVPGRKLTVTGYAMVEAELTARLSKAERALRRSVVPIGVDLPASDRAERWWFDDLTDDQRRMILGAVVGAVVVKPVGKGRRNFPYEDYTAIEWRR